VPLVPVTSGFTEQHPRNLKIGAAWGGKLGGLAHGSLLHLPVVAAPSAEGHVPQAVPTGEGEKMRLLVMPTAKQGVAHMQPLSHRSFWHIAICYGFNSRAFASNQGVNKQC